MEVRTDAGAEVSAVESVVEWDGHRTWCQYWSGSGPRTGLPVLVVHGGPGYSHDYLRNLAALRYSGRAVIFYDQLGGGRSDHLPDRAGDEEFWTPELFIRELASVVAEFGLQQSGYHLAGHSWGGSIAMQWAVGRPPGLASLIVMGAPSTMRTWTDEAERLRADFPEDVRATLERHERAGTTDSEEYEEAALVFYRRHICRLDPWPSDLDETFRRCAEDPTVYNTMFGPNEFTLTGNLSTWSIDSDLHRIAAPTLVMRGEYDAATETVVAASHSSIPNAEYRVVNGVSHCFNLEDPERILGIMADWLSRRDS